MNFEFALAVEDTMREAACAILDLEFDLKAALSRIEGAERWAHYDHCASVVGRTR